MMYYKKLTDKTYVIGVLYNSKDLDEEYKKELTKLLLRSDNFVRIIDEHFYDIVPEILPLSPDSCGYEIKYEGKE